MTAHQQIPAINWQRGCGKGGVRCTCGESSQESADQLAACRHCALQRSWQGPTTPSWRRYWRGRHQAVRWLTGGLGPALADDRVGNRRASCRRCLPPRGHPGPGWRGAHPARDAAGRCAGHRGGQTRRLAADRLQGQPVLPESCALPCYRRAAVAAGRRGARTARLAAQAPAAAR